MEKEIWIQEKRFDGIYIKKGNTAKTPVAVVAVPIGWHENAIWAAEAERKANLIMAAPIMLFALKMALFFMDKNNEAYQTVEDAIKLAEGEENEQ